MKKLPVCKTCVSGSLCFSCQERFDKGFITQFDIDLAVDLLEMESEDHPELKTASLYNAVDVGDIVFLVVGKGNISKNKYRPELLNKIKELYEIPRLMLIEKGSVKSMIEQIIEPAKLLGVNEIFIPTGDKEYRVVISDEDRDKIQIPVELLEKACSQIIRGDTKIQFG